MMTQALEMVNRFVPSLSASALPEVIWQVSGTSATVGVVTAPPVEAVSARVTVLSVIARATSWTVIVIV